MYDRILLPTDGSDASNPAVEEAIALAEDVDATLCVLFVVEDFPYAPEMMDDTVEAQLRTIGEETLENIHDRATEAGVTVQTDLEWGKPHEAILEYAHTQDCDLIVMGTHGRSGLDRYLLGSVTERVVRSAEIPVLTIRRSSE